MKDASQPEDAGRVNLQGAPQDIDSASSLSFADIGRMLVRHKWFIVICVLIGTGISLFIIHTATPIYLAAGDLRIDPGRAGSLGLGDLAGGAGSFSDPTPTEIAIMKSDAVAIETLNLISDAQFREYAGADRKTLGIPKGATSLSPAQEGLLGMFKSQLDAAEVPTTELVSVSFRHPNPKLAALMVNTTIDAYLKQSFDDRYNSIQEVRKWLDSEMVQLKDQANEAQERLVDFQEKNNILGAGVTPSGVSDGAASSSESGGSGGEESASGGGGGELSQLNARLATAQADRILKEAQMRAANSGNAALVAVLFPTASVSAIQAEQSRLAVQYAQMSSKFGPNYPALIDLRNQMAKTDAALNKVLADARSRAAQEYQIALSIENTVRQQYNEATTKAFAVNRKQAEYSALRAESISSRELFNTLTAKLQQASIEASLSNINTMRVDSARAPLFPIEPKKTIILSFGVFLGLFAGIGAAFLIEATSDKVQGVEQVESTLHYHVLATIPHISQPKMASAVDAASPGSSHFMLVAYSEPQSREAEAYRSIRNAVLLSAGKKEKKTVLITSTIPGEGKSSTAANYAIVLAQKGSRVLIIDSDLRRPTLHKLFGCSNELGLSDILLEESPGNAFKQPLAELKNLSLLTAGKPVPLPSEALGSERFYSLLQNWEQSFDYIVIDSAPLLIVSDSHPLASWVDMLVLITRYNVTPISGLKRIRAVLSRTNASVAGVVVNDLAASATGYYGGYGYDYYK
jgi:succinoglycan biosynthesis transport protein ExoP